MHDDETASLGLAVRITYSVAEQYLFLPSMQKATSHLFLQSSSSGSGLAVVVAVVVGMVISPIELVANSNE